MFFLYEGDCGSSEDVYEWERQLAGYFFKVLVNGMGETGKKIERHSNQIQTTKPGCFSKKEM